MEGREVMPNEQIDLERYSRQIMLPEIGLEGQKRLLASSVLIVGAGGLGSPVALYLAAAGVGTIGLIDPDNVDRSNLHRQVLFSDDSVGEPKVEQAASRLLAMNPDLSVRTYRERLTPENGARIVGEYDVIVDGADNFATRYLCNDVAVETGTPLIHGSIYRFEGQVSVLAMEPGPCYRCLYPTPPEPGSVPSCGEIGVLGLLPGLVGTVMATEAVKVLLSLGIPLVGRLLMYDALSMSFRELTIERDPGCPACGENRTLGAVKTFDYGTFCGVTEAGVHQQNEIDMKSIEVADLARMREDGVEHILIDVREPNEYEHANIGGTLIPLGEIAERKEEIPKEGRVIVMCRSGGRSGQACAIMQAAGWENVENLNGGILAWSSKIDSTIPSY